MYTDFASILDNLAEIDWKGESQDVLHALRESYKLSYPALSGKSLDELAENYATEPTDDFINAFGQELSTLALLLYEIDADSDSYMLAIIPIESEDEWKAFLKQHKKKGKPKKQPRSKLGTGAKRLDYGVNSSLILIGVNIKYPISP